MLKSVLIALVCVFALTLVDSAQAQLSGLQKLRASSKSALLPFKDSLFERYVKSERRDYSIYLLFDAGNDVECPYCAGMRKQLTVVATLYNRSIESRPASEQPIFFGVITPKTGGQTFKDFNIQGVPFLICIPPGESGQRFDASLFQIKSLEALSEPYAIAAWVQESSGVTVHIPLPFFRRPEVQYTGLAILILLVLWRLPWLLRNYNRPMVGFVLFMIVYVVVMNGTVWNAIHEPPFYVGSGAKLTLFAPSMQSQFKVEGGIMATLFVVLMTLWILLTDYAPNIRYTVLRIPFTAIVFCFFVFLLNSLFRIFSHMKMGGGYPFYFDLPGLLA